MRLGTAIECLVDNYKYASDKEWINDKVAWALYHTWKEADRKTEPSNSEKPNNSTISKMEQVDKDINVRSKDCETCKHYKLACELFSEICKYEPTTQTETQNSNLTFEKDECAKEYEELGLKELKELIKADRKDEPQNDWETEKRNNSLCYKCVKECDRRVLNRYTIECNQYEPKDEPQTDCPWK